MAKQANKVLVADCQALCREGLMTIFKKNSYFSDIYEASNFPAVLSRLEAHPTITLISIDLDLPDLNKAEGLRDLRVRYPELRVVVVAETRDRDLVLDALSAGVHGYIPKDTSLEEILEAVRTVLAGHVYVPTLICELATRNDRIAAHHAMPCNAALTARQTEVLDLLASGRSNKEIARLLCIAEGTVKVHIAAAFRLLGVHNRVSAAAAMQAWPAMGHHAGLPPGMIERRARPSFRRNSA